MDLFIVYRDYVCHTFVTSPPGMFSFPRLAQSNFICLQPGYQAHFLLHVLRGLTSVGLQQGHLLPRIYREHTRQSTRTSPRDQVNDCLVLVLLEDQFPRVLGGLKLLKIAPVLRVPGGLKGLRPASPQGTWDLKGLSPTSPKGTWGVERTESRQSPGLPGGLKGLNPASPHGTGGAERTESGQSPRYPGAKKG